MNLTLSMLVDSVGYKTVTGNVLPKSVTSDSVNTKVCSDTLRPLRRVPITMTRTRFGWRQALQSTRNVRVENNPHRACLAFPRRCARIPFIWVINHLTHIKLRFTRFGRGPSWIIRFAIAFFVTAIVSFASGELKLTSNGGGFGDIPLDADNLQAEHGYMDRSLGENVSVHHPSPEVQMQGVVLDESEYDWTYGQLGPGRAGPWSEDERQRRPVRYGTAE